VHHLVNEPIQRFSSTLRYSLPFFPKSHLIDHVQTSTQALVIGEAVRNALPKLLVLPNKTSRSQSSKRSFRLAYENYMALIIKNTVRQETTSAYVRMITTLIHGIDHERSLTFLPSSTDVMQWSWTTP
jgi:hypothetical protein